MNWDGPHCPSWTGGVAATSTKVAKHRQGADGVGVQMVCSSLNNHPVCADCGCFAVFSFWHSHPSCPGGAMGLIPIRSHLHRPPTVGTCYSYPDPSRSSSPNPKKCAISCMTVILTCSLISSCEVNSS